MNTQEIINQFRNARDRYYGGDIDAAEDLLHACGQIELVLALFETRTRNLEEIAKTLSENYVLTPEDIERDGVALALSNKMRDLEESNRLFDLEESNRLFRERA